MDDYNAPDLGHMSERDLCGLMFMCGFSNDPSDKAFVKACRDELSKRKNIKLEKMQQPPK